MPSGLSLELMRILETSRFLQSTLPRVRIYSLRETLRFANEEKAVDVLLENVTTSPHIPADRKEPLANMVLNREWHGLKSALQCVDPPSEDTQLVPDSEQDAFTSFRQMVATVFTTSRRLHGIPESIKRRLGASIYQCDSIDALKELCISSLLNSTAFVDRQRDAVANAVMDDPYDLLIVTDLFDCEVGARRAAVASKVRGAVAQVRSGVRDIFRMSSSSGVSTASAESEPEPEPELECAICLGSRTSDCVLACTHAFCKDCVRDWVAQDPTCPMCRQPIDLSTLSLA